MISPPVLNLSSQHYFGTVFKNPYHGAELMGSFATIIGENEQVGEGLFGSFILRGANLVYSTFSPPLHCANFISNSQPLEVQEL